MFASSSKFLAFLALVLVTETVVAGPSVVPARAGLHSKFARRALKRKRVDDAQTSLQLDPSQIGPNLALTGQEVPAAGQVPSLTSTNNYINFCLTQDTVLTDGKQTTTGSCNQTPMGRIIASDKIPVSTFTFPVNGGAIKANTNFTIKMSIINMNVGHFTNPATTYYNAPQTVDSNGLGIGHSHVVAEKISAFDTQELTDPRNFAFFKGLNGALDANGQLTADVTGGLPVGFYKLSSINTAANHQPLLFAIAQHGTTDTCIYFEVTDDGKPSAANIAANPKSATVDTNASASVSASASSTASSAATASASASSVDSASASSSTASSVASEAASAATSTTTTAAAAASSTTSASANTNKGKGGKNGKNNVTTSVAAATDVASSSVAASSAATTSSAATDKGNKGKNGKNDKVATSAASSAVSASSSAAASTTSAAVTTSTSLAAASTASATSSAA